MNKIIFYFASLLCISTRLYPATITAVASGNWENASTWSGGIFPACNDIVQIPAGVSVTITSQPDYTGCGGPMIIYVNGILNFQNGKKLDLDCNSYIFIQSGGSITSSGGGGTSNLITICTVAVWTTSMGNIDGPDTLYVNSSNGPLSVIFLSFTLRNLADNQVALNWTTATETNNDHFDVERSKDGIYFESVGRIKAYGDGNSASKHDYASSDPEPYEGISYYRLKQFDKNGDFKYSNISSIDLPKKSVLNIYPNPASTQLFIETNGDYPAGQAIIYDVLGKKIQTAEISNARNQLDISFLDAGVYHLVLDNGIELHKARIIVQK